MGIGNVSERRLEPPQVGISVVILALGPHRAEAECPRSRLWLPLVRRVRQPFAGCWALPGGDVKAARSLERCAYEALESTTSLHPRYLEQLYTFGGPDRSHGALPMVSIVYWALVGQGETRRFRQSDDVRWFPEDELPRLAFDHRAIVEYALHRLRDKVTYSDVATRLLGPTFTLRQLHDVHEAIAGEAIDLANFRRKMLSSGELEDTGGKMRVGRQRPAAVYRYVPRLGGDLVEPSMPEASEAAADASDDPLDALVPSRNRPARLATACVSE